jgi:hypothetical protein
MAVSIMNQTSESITLQVTIPFTRSMLHSEGVIQDAVNEVGCVATRELLKTFDTDGQSLQFGSVKMTTKGLYPKTYQTPYGEADVERHLYQASTGGTTFCPLEQEARMILTSTPRFAMQVSHKMSEMSAPAVQKDFEMNHNRSVVHAMMQRLSEAVASVVQAKEETWSYSVPKIEESSIKTVSIGLDGTCLLMCGGAYRQAMVGTIALYDEEGERQHTTYIAAPPEYGKETFKARLTREIERATALYPSAIKIGVADGAPDNWDFLTPHTDKQTLDFYHATEYLAGVADALFESSLERKRWLKDRCHGLKHTPGSAKIILAEMKHFEQSLLNNEPLSWIPSHPVEGDDLLKKQDEETVRRSKKGGEKKHKSLSAAITYFTNNTGKSRMDYAESVALNHPIGSGVTEAACKTIVKQRLGQSGMQWKEKGAGIILSLRALSHSTGRWEQFWQKVNQFGLPMTL